jgi:hypothetical protein
MMAAPGWRRTMAGGDEAVFEPIVGQEAEVTKTGHDP